MQPEHFQAGLEFRDVMSLATRLVAELGRQELHITTVESCTGGALASAISDVPGASDIMKDAFVTYSNDAKIALGVPAETIDNYGVYSPQTAQAMAIAGLRRSVAADIAVGITGSLSRVDPANQDSVPGEVYVGIARKSDPDGSPEQVAISRIVVPPLERPAAKLVIVHYALDTALGQVASPLS